VVEFAIQLRIDANNNNTRECNIHAMKNKNPQIAYKTFQTNKIYFVFTWSFILQIGIVNNSFTNANTAQIAVTHHALPTVSWTYIEKNVSVHNPRPIIKRAKDKEIDLIFNGITFGNICLIFFRIIPLF
jgi:hypothetical protein